MLITLLKEQLHIFENKDQKGNLAVVTSENFPSTRDIPSCMCADSASPPIAIQLRNHVWPPQPGLATIGGMGADVAWKIVCSHASSASFTSAALWLCCGEDTSLDLSLPGNLLTGLWIQSKFFLKVFITFFFLSLI